MRSGALHGPALVERLLAVPYLDRDLWVDELFGLSELPADMPNLPRGSVPYLPAPVEEILTMVMEAPLRADDELVDLGAGLGRVVMLAHLLTGARARGVEIQPHLVDSARGSAAELGLSALSFDCANAADADLDGSVFFLYSPFNGELLTQVVRRLSEVAQRRSIVVCAVGLELPSEPWLQKRASSCPSLSIYDSHLAQVPRRSMLRDWYSVPAWRRAPVSPSALTG